MTRGCAGAYHLGIQTFDLRVHLSGCDYHSPADRLCLRLAGMFHGRRVVVGCLVGRDLGRLVRHLFQTHGFSWFLCCLQRRRWPRLLRLVWQMDCSAPHTPVRLETVNMEQLSPRISKYLYTLYCHTAACRYGLGLCLRSSRPCGLTCRLWRREHKERHSEWFQTMRADPKSQLTARKKLYLIKKREP